MTNYKTLSYAKNNNFVQKWRVMNIEEFREFCLSLPDSSEKMPFQAFRAAQSILAFYVGGKIFCFFDIDKFDVCTVKCDPDKIDELKAEYKVVSAPYNMNSKHWISIRFNGDMPDKEIKYWTKNSYEIILKIYENTKKKRLKHSKGEHSALTG